MPPVIVINFHGGYPSSMIDRALCELSGFVRLTSMSHTYDHAYPTNACAGPALHDTVMDAPLGSMADSIWHPWAFVNRATRTIFHVFKQHGYTTRLFGCFGLDSRLDPGVHMHTECDHLNRVLQMYGIDCCDSQDASFTCQVGSAHDHDTMTRFLSHMREVGTTENAFTMVNLLGCQDAHRCTFAQLDPQQTGATPCVNEYDERRFAESVLDDNVRDRKSASHRIEPLRRAAHAQDWLRGTHDAALREETTRAVTEMHYLCWKALTNFNRSLEDLLDILEGRGCLDSAVLYIYSDHPMSLFEHGEICEAPWEACLKSFWIRKGPRSASTRNHLPKSLSQVPLALFEDASVSPSPIWQMPYSGECCITLGLACSWLARASVQPEISTGNLRTFFLRAIVTLNNRPYATTFWFSVSDLVRTGVDQWENPVLRNDYVAFAARSALQVYEHTSDPREVCNMAEDELWLKSETAIKLKSIIDASICEQKLQNIRLRLPNCLSSVSLNSIDLCSVQLLHRNTRKLARPVSSRAPIVEKRHCSTQTETPSLLSALQEMYGYDVGRLLNGQLPKGVAPDQPLTIFAPEKQHQNNTKWLSWTPPPLRGAYTRDIMKRVAAHGLSVTDANGETHTMQPSDDENVFLKQCRILLRSAVNIFHSRGYVVGYMVCPKEEESEIAVNAITDKASQQDAAQPPSVPALRSNAGSTKSRQSITNTRAWKDKDKPASSQLLTQKNKSVRDMESKLHRHSRK